ncbi:hypothetical protein F2Q70_00010722 [Brassica cretica]|uniref:Uncharacterized protein n=1 Tax=Brassica cretica TaxID=69181 RepID=A0A8S9NZX9_BRACR|nr:hypothetical protein F2Q70_00010722 [Brassica cretica]KAF3509296.1 hypothetical protein F2Q69_00004642 [Brassica cretica]
MVESWTFASPSAKPFSVRGMKPENGELEEEAKESVSDRIPKRSIVHFLCVIARWSTWNCSKTDIGEA